MHCVGAVNRLRASVAGIGGPVHEIWAVLDDRDKPFVKGGPRIFPGICSSIRFDGVFFSYRTGLPVFDGLNLEFKRGSTTAIVGTSGAGKSTLVNLLLRLYDPQRGRILMDETDIREFDLASLRKRVAMVSQETVLFNDTLEANLLYGLDGVSEEALWIALEQARLTSYIRRLPDGLHSVVGDRGLRLSGGEKQRVSIVRAILKGANILILDEATSSLDSETETMIQEAIEAVTLDKTAIIIAHRLSTIQKAGRVVVMEEGKIIEDGVPAKLLAASGAFRRLWEKQMFAN
jgi:subfamily B ATP-binding cassette protein MsbA